MQECFHTFFTLSNDIRPSSLLWWSHSWQKWLISSFCTQCVVHCIHTLLFCAFLVIEWIDRQWECGCVVVGLVIRLRPTGVTYVYWTTDYDLIIKRGNWEDDITKIGRADGITIGLCFVTGDSCIALFDGMYSLVRHAEMELMSQFHQFLAPRLRM